MVSLTNLVKILREETSTSLTLIEYALAQDRAALERLQLAYLLQFEVAALTYIYHNPEAKRLVEVPAGVLQFAVKLSSTTIYFALQNDLDARWLFIYPRIGNMYVARLTAESLLWTWYFLDAQLTGVSLELYLFDAIVVTPPSLGAEVLQSAGNTTVTNRVTRVDMQLQGRSFGTAYQTGSTLTRALPSLIEEVVDFLLQKWYVMIASMKSDLLREVEDQLRAVETYRVNAGRAVQKLSELTDLAVVVTKQGAQKGSELIFDFSVAASNFNFDATLEEVIETERYNAELQLIYTALQEIDVRAIAANAVTSTRNEAVKFFSTHGTDTLISIVTLAAGQLAMKNAGTLTSSSKMFVMSTWGIANTVFQFLKSGVYSASMGVVVQTWGYLKFKLGVGSAIAVHNLVGAVAPVSPFIATKYKVVAGLVVMVYLYRNSYLDGAGELAVTTLREVFKMSVYIAIPIIPTGLVYYTSSMFLAVGPTSALAAATFVMGAMYSMYQMSPKKVQKEVDQALGEALSKSAQLLPKIPEVAGRLLDSAGPLLLAGAAVYALTSFPGTFSLANGSMLKRKGTQQVRKLKEKRQK